MNRYLQQSIEYASSRCYLDDLFRVYPTIPNGIRDIDKEIWGRVENAFSSQNNEALISSLLDLDLFPIKDSYVAYLRIDRSAISRNPKTINRLAGELYEMGLNRIFENCSKPKETNRQMGPKFKAWISNKSLGLTPVPIDIFKNTKEDAILSGSDKEMKDFAHVELGYDRDKGLDLLARFNGKYVIGEAKFLTDHGGHQNAQLNDALSTISAEADAVKIAILDGVCYIEGDDKMYKTITEEYGECNIMSALLLRNFLYSL